MTLLTAEALHRLYTEQGRSDREIADFFGIRRDSVSYLRRRFGIPTREYTGGVGELATIQALKERGFDVVDMNEEDKRSPFDLLVNGHVRVEVKTSYMSDDGRFRFQLCEKAECGTVESETRIRLKNGRTRKLFTKTCDYIILVGINRTEHHYFIVPASAIGNTVQTINVPLKEQKNSKYGAYRDAWHLLM
jgi:hypothetical protein